MVAVTLAEPPEDPSDRLLRDLVVIRDWVLRLRESLRRERMLDP